VTLTKKFNLMSRFFIAAILFFLGCSAQEKHALAFTTRGFGASSSARFSQKNIKRQSDTITQYQEKMQKLTAYWHDDLLAASQLLRIKVGSAKKWLY
jgi:hypothetical protein